MDNDTGHVMYLNYHRGENQTKITNQPLHHFHQDHLRYSRSKADSFQSSNRHCQSQGCRRKQIFNYRTGKSFESTVTSKCECLTQDDEESNIPTARSADACNALRRHESRVIISLCFCMIDRINTQPPYTLALFVPFHLIQRIHPTLHAPCTQQIFCSRSFVRKELS